jgi:hypothetical protein
MSQSPPGETLLPREKSAGEAGRMRDPRDPASAPARQRRYFTTKLAKDTKAFPSAAALLASLVSLVVDRKRLRRAWSLAA